MSEDELPEQMRVRREKVDRLRARGVAPYAFGFPRTTSIGELRATHGDLPADVATGERAAVAGRVMLSRTGGKLCFATLREGYDELQVMVSLDRVGEESLSEWKASVDLGDHVGVEGEVITSRRGELSILVERWEITAKALRPLPDKYKGLTDPEARVRQRYLDLIVNPGSRRNVEIRSATVKSLRASFDRRGYLEVETPMLQVLHGGATARPFVTHINAYDIDLYLRIAPELYLKRLIVGGIDKVFEINRNFRNEGADSSHSPEFAMLEAYEAYGDYRTIGRLTRELVQEAAVAVFGSTTVTHADGTEHDLGGEWPWISLYEVTSEALGEHITPRTPRETLVAYAEKHDVAVDPAWLPG
jgi:lysyl-tRNA synthetase class 2